MPEWSVLLPLHEEVHYQWHELLHTYCRLSAYVFLGALYDMQELERFVGFELAKTDMHRSFARTISASDARTVAGTTDAIADSIADAIANGIVDAIQGRTLCPAVR